MDIPHEIVEAAKKTTLLISDISWIPIRPKKIVPIVAIYVGSV
jgi:hypothetical protein